VVKNVNATWVQMSVRAILPGGLIALALTACAFLALLIALGIRGDGPFSFGLGDADGSARLEGGGSALLDRAVSTTPFEGAPVALPGGVVAAGARTVARRSSSLRGATNGRQVAGRRNARTPSRRSPVATPTAPTTTNTTAGGTTRPTATSTPNPDAVKVRGRGETPPRVDVRKQRVTSRTPAATPTPVPLRPVPPPSTPELERQAAPAPAPADTGVGADDGVLTRVPPPSATP
jgi:hypothetical protein